MERDFMGLAVKQEVLDEPIDAAPVRSLPMHWSFPNKVSALPQLLSFQEEKPKTGFDSLASTGLVTITTTDSEHKSYSGVVQNLICSVSTQPLGGVLTSNHVPAIPSSSPVVGTTDLRNASKISGAPAQLTIFYNGSVCVYDNISPDKAQAIMLLAGNGPPANSSITVPAVPVQASVPKSSVLDGFVVSQPYGTTALRSIPTSITSISVSQSAVRSSTINDTTASKPGGVLVSSNKVEPLKVVNSQAPASSNFLPSGTVPQFRRKSLARFLEKRKER
ncbi:UNVERIFIED_CONTAM: protein TIFY 6B [Sesamum radiatum]|uniref:Protein TIFY n=1 Tax=Sesamum radiatum TaxID=300843 RepID=A0AAW2RYB6_SESRA